MRTVTVMLLLGAALASVDVASAASGNAIVTVAGTGQLGDTGDGGQATEAQIRLPRSIFPTTDGGYIWAEPYSNRVRRVGRDGIITTVAGNGQAGYGGDGGPATMAKLNFVHGASPTPDGGFLVADNRNNRIRKVSTDGKIRTVAGTGQAGFSGDGGPATVAKIDNPLGVTALADGGFLIPDSYNHRVRRVSRDGTITTVAGNGTKGFSGDGGQAAAAELSLPFGAVPTADGGFLVVDTGNNRIRKVDPSGRISTVAGNGQKGFGGDGGPAVQASLYYPHNAVASADGGFIIADTLNERVRQVDATGKITTVAGTGSVGFSGEGGPATSAKLDAPKAVALTSSGGLLIADESNNRIRFVGTAVVPKSTTPPSISGTTEQGETLTAAAGGWTGTGPVIAYQWLRCNSSGASCVDIGGATSEAYTVASTDAGSALRIEITASNAAGSATAISVATSPVPGGGGPPPPPPPPDDGAATFSVAASGDDGRVRVRGSSYPPSGAPSVSTGGSKLTAERSLESGTYAVSVPLLRFDTSSLPDRAQITSATLRLNVRSNSNADGRNLVGEWYSAANWPIDAADYSLNAANNAFVGTSIEALSTMTELTLGNLGNISTTGLTALRLHVDGGQPNGLNVVDITAFESSGTEAQMVVTYTVP